MHAAGMADQAMLPVKKNIRLIIWIQVAFRKLAGLPAITFC